MKNNPKVSVLLPTFNHGQFLDEAIVSVLSQTFTNFELVIVDNNSSDNTDEVVRKFLADSRVSFYKNVSNLGMVGNYNKCLSYAKAPLIKFLNSDDKFHPLLLEKFIGIADSYPTVSLISSNHEIFGVRNEVISLPHFGFHDGKFIIYETLKTFNWLGSPTSVMFKKCDLNAGFGNEFTYLLDWNTWLKLLSRGDCYIIPEILSFHRTHPGQVTAELKNCYTTRFEEYRFYKKIYDGGRYGINNPELKKRVKTKAGFCATIVYKTFFDLVYQQKRTAFKKALAIALGENVLFDPIKRFFRKWPFFTF